MNENRNIPNLLFIFTDQQKLETLACYGNDKIQMPNLNRLSEQAVVVDEPHCTQPVCTPSRGSIMTGLWPHTHGALNNNVPLNADAPCLPELLSPEKRAAYRTAYMGKWHLGDEIFIQHGFDEWVSIEDGYYPHYSAGRDVSQRSSYYHFLTGEGFVPAKSAHGFTGFSRNFAAQMPERYGKPHFLGMKASDFIYRNVGRPWLLTVNFLEPHPPNQSCRDEQYDPDEVDLPDNFESLPGADQPAFLRSHIDKLEKSGQVPERKHWREYIARYWGLNSLVDSHVGRILDTLEATGQRENTIIVFTSDHGDMMGAHGLLHKCVMFKEATRVPLLISLPGQQTQGRITGPVSQIDLVPTLLDLMGEGASADKLPGSSLADICRQAASGRSVSAQGTASDCIIEWNPGHQACTSVSRTIVTHQQERYSYYSDDQDELYDLKDDPGETRNLAPEEQQQPSVRKLRERIAKWQEQVADTAASIAGIS